MSAAPDASPAPAIEAGDYRLDNGDWNGAQDLFLLAQGQQVQLVPHETMDLSTLKLDEPLILVYPSASLDVESLARFVIDGGRVWLADDFGQSEGLLKRLALKRTAPPHGALPHDEYFQQNPALPILRPIGVHPLLVDVEAVVANHPAVLVNDGGPVVPYSQQGGLVYDMNLGKGKVVVFADASMLINHMLTVGDNAKLLRNTLRYICKERQPCTAHLLVGAAKTTGRYGRDEDRDWRNLKDDALRDAQALNELIRELMERLPADQLFYYLGLILAVGLAVYLFSIFPARATRPYSTYIAENHRTPHPPQSEFDWNMARYGASTSGMNYELPAALLKALFEEIFYTHLGMWPLDGKPDPADVGRAFARQVLSEHPAGMSGKLEAEVVSLVRELARVPARSRVGLDTEVYISARELVRLHERCLEILEVMGLKDDYARRTRSTL